MVEDLNSYSDERQQRRRREQFQRPPRNDRQTILSQTGWTDDPSGVDATNQFEWVAERVGTAGNWGEFSAPALWAKFGEKGDQGDQGEVGPAGEGLTWREAWNRNTTYAVRDLVSHDGSAWIATRAGSGNEPSGSSASWDLYAEKGATGSGFDWQGTWSSTTAYTRNDIVQDRGSSWIATRPSTNSRPSGASANWDLYAERGEKGDPGDAGSIYRWRGVWSNTTSYGVNDLVRYQGNAYVATAANRGETPADSGRSSTITGSGTSGDPYVIGQFGTDLNILSLLDTASRGDETFFSIPNPGAGSWSITFTTNSGQDWDTHLRARRGTTNQSTDSEISDTTPHTLTVTAQNNTDNIQLEIQWWETGGQPTSATLNVSAPAAAAGNWSLFAAAGSDGSPGTDGTGFTWRGNWSSTRAYAVRDIVAHNGSAWVATQASTNQTPSGSSAHWDLFAEKGEKGDKGDQGDQGEPGRPGRDATAADRAPGLFQIAITSAQQRSLTSANDFDLPNALETLANNATPGDNKIGDFVRFYRGGYSDYWTWTDRTTDRWERTLDFLGAAQIQTVDIRAITGNFADLNVSGVLTASKVDAPNLQDLTQLWRGDWRITSTTATSQNLAGPKINEFAQFGLLVGYSSQDWSVLIVTDSINVGTNWSNPLVTGAIFSAANYRLGIKRNTSFTRLDARIEDYTGRTSRLGWRIWSIYGIGDQIALTPTATVTYNRTSPLNRATTSITATFSSMTGVTDLAWEVREFFGNRYVFLRDNRTITRNQGQWRYGSTVAIRMTWIQNNVRHNGPEIVFAGNGE